ncbi:MAG TPA: AEC family transporter, partial [Methanoregula sp.]|nr:AEC family transporter [Methanoregula sp.]
MDNLTIPVILPEYESVVMFLLVFLIVQLLKHRGIFNDTHQPVFDRLVIELALPAIIFASLATTHVHADWIMPVLIMIAAIIVCLVIAWGTCRMLRLTPAVTGTVVILSGFGSTYTFAAPLVGSIFGKASEQMSFALFLDTFGVAIPFFTIGVLIAGYYGQKERGENPSASSTLKQFLATPIFLAFILGLLSSLLFANLLLPGAGVFADVFSGFFTVIQDSLSLLVWIAIGLLLRPIRLRTLLPLLALVVAVQMIIMPALV